MQQPPTESPQRDFEHFAASGVSPTAGAKPEQQLRVLRLRPLTLLLVLLVLLLLLLDQVLPRQRRLRLRYDYDYNGCCDYHDDYY